MQEKRGWPFWFAVSVLKPLLLTFTKHTWIEPERIPSSGGCVVAINHISHIDPVTAAHLVYDYGRLPHYLAKAGLWKKKPLGRLLTALGQIPVERETGGAGAFAAAVEAIRRGELIVVYPEATITRDPDMWPMRGKTGAARLALETGCPVIPVGQWGAHKILPPYTKKPLLFPRKRVTMAVGEPVALSDLAAQEPRTIAVVTEATDRIMAAITQQLEGIRNEKAPAERYDMRIHGDRFKDRKKAS